MSESSLPNLESTHIMKAADSKTVLLVEDDPVARTLVAARLKYLGYHVLEADDGLPGLDLFFDRQPDLVILDVLMQGMNGYEVCRNIRASGQGKNVPILIMTGLNDQESIANAFQVGATDFVTKPVNGDLLGHRVEYLLRSARASAELRSSEERLGLAQQMAKLGYWEWRGGSENLYCSKECRHILGRDFSQGKEGMREFLKQVHPADRSRVRRALLEVGLNGRDFQIQHRIVTEDGVEKSIEHEAKALAMESGLPVRILGLLRDTTDRVKMERKVHQLAYYDEVTRFPNRAYLLEFLTNRLTQIEPGETQVTLLSIGLDYFKRINNTLGYAAGNEVLREVANRLRSFGEYLENTEHDGQVKVALVVRLSGDEYVIVLEHSPEVRNEDGVEFTPLSLLISDQISNQLSRPLLVEGREVSITCSIGLSAYPDDGADAETLLINAGTAMHQAKKRGRNACQVFEHEWSQRAKHFLTIESELRQAIEQSQFVLHYQPKVNLVNERVEGMEALIRWVHPTMGFISPVDFIPIAEQSGQIVPLGLWVLETGLRQLAKWNQEGLGNLRLSINVSGAQLKQPGLEESCATLLEELKVPPNQLELELTEGLLMENTEANIALFKRIAATGVEISVDDFGTGYSSLSYLTRFPLSTLKVDRAFVHDASTNRDNAAIVSAVAEGVEEKPELDFLRGLRCDAVQGYYFSKPLPAEEFASFVREFNSMDTDRMAA